MANKRIESEICRVSDLLLLQKNNEAFELSRTTLTTLYSLLSNPGLDSESGSSSGGSGSSNVSGSEVPSRELMEYFQVMGVLFVTAGVKTRQFEVIEGFVNQVYQSVANVPSMMLIPWIQGLISVNCIIMARSYIEEWLTSSPEIENLSNHEKQIENYSKVIELYVLHILPELKDFQSAQAFLQYNILLPDQKKKIYLEYLMKLEKQNEEKAKTLHNLEQTNKQKEQLSSLGSSSTQSIETQNQKQPQTQAQTQNNPSKKHPTQRTLNSIPTPTSTQPNNSNQIFSIDINKLKQYQNLIVLVFAFILLLIKRNDVFGSKFAQKFILPLFKQLKDLIVIGFNVKPR